MFTDKWHIKSTYWGKGWFIIKIFIFQESMDSISIQVYYESLCPDSINFITQQLYPTYQKLGKYLTIEFKPFGNAEVTKMGLEYGSHHKLN